MDDTISRQQAIDALDRFSLGETDVVKLAFRMGDYLKRLPSVEAQIVHCRDCKNLEIDSIFHDCWCNGHKVWLDHYCGYAERRTDG